MAQARINCPNCKQPIVADIQQLFDVGEDPSAKAKLLSGMVNVVQCPYCKYQGNLSSVIVYHDPNKELLLTFVPPELGMQRDNSERLIGNLINQVVNRLPNEQRKGYLLRPQAFLTLAGLLEKILEADGITKEMIQAQQQRLNVLQRLAATDAADVQLEIIKQEEALIDADLFAILSRLIETAAVTGDRGSAEHLENIQKLLLENTAFGKEIQSQRAEVEAAVKSLQSVGKELTREKLLDVVIEAPNEIRLSALVSLTRPGMDYTFFQLLSERIEKSAEPEKARLVALRERLLVLTREIDLQMEARAGQANQLLKEILSSPDVTQATEQNLGRIDEFFLQTLEMELEASRKSGDLERIAQLQKVMAVIQAASAPPPEISLIEDLVDAPDAASRRKLLEDHRDQITPEFMQALSSLITQISESDQDPVLVERFKEVNREVLHFSMQANLKSR
jgi:hypothetical protein